MENYVKSTYLIFQHTCHFLMDVGEVSFREKNLIEELADMKDTAIQSAGCGGRKREIVSKSLTGPRRENEHSTYEKGYSILLHFAK